VAWSDLVWSGFGFGARQESLVLFGPKETPGMVFLELRETLSEED
jgi:hypothetical protein